MTASRNRVVAVTGGTGFLGRYVISALGAAGWTVRMLVRPGAGRVLPADVEVVAGDLSDEAALTRLVHGADAVVHMAGAIKGRTLRDFMQVNRDGSRRLAEVAVRHRRDLRVVVVSSLAAREPQLSHYAQSKAAGEQAFRITPLSNLAILRPPVIYGPGDRETGAWLKAALGPIFPIPHSPGARLCMIHAADVAAAIVAFCQEVSITGVYELSDDRVEGYEWRELAALVTETAGGGARVVEVPAPLLRVAGWGGALAAWLLRRAAMLSPGKVREMLHPNWGSSATRQPPPELWRPQRGGREGLAETFRHLHPGGVEAGQAGPEATEVRQ